MPAPKITLYVDVVSPFAYMAYWLIRNTATFKHCQVTYVPIFLGGVMKACGNATPISIKNKGKWIETERTRTAKQFQIPMTPTTPEGFPILTLFTMRALCALEVSKPALLPKVLDALYEEMWVNANVGKIDKPEGLMKCLVPVLGETEARRIAQEAGEAAAKKRLSENSDKAFQDGAFGLPWFIATNEKGETESYWGVDHMGQLIQHLDLDKKKLGVGHQAML